MTLRVAFYKGTRPGIPGLYNRLVRLIDGGPFSHCELIFSDGMCASSSFMDGGVRYKQMTPDPAKWEIRDLSSPFDEATARAWFDQHNGAGYDLAGNLRFVFRWWPHSRSRWFCSEAIGAALGLSTPENLGPNGLASVLQSMASVQRGGGNGEER